MRSVAHILKAARARQGLSRLEAARRCGVSYESLADLERGQTANPKAETLGRLSAGLGIDLDELLTAPAAGNGSRPDVDPVQSATTQAPEPASPPTPAAPVTVPSGLPVPHSSAAGRSGGLGIAPSDSPPAAQPSGGA